MGLYNVLNRTLMQQGQPEDISEVVANFDALATILNGQIDPVNMRGAPALALGETYVWDGIQHVRSSATKLNASQLTDLANHSSPAQVNAANTDMAFPNTYAAVVDLMPDVAGTAGTVRSLGAGKFDGQRTVIRHSGAAGTLMTILNNTAGGGAGTVKFLLRDQQNLVMNPLDTIEFVYVAALNFWIEIGRGRAGSTILFDSGYLGAAQANFDTGAGGFTTGYNHLRVRIIGRGDTVANTVNVVGQLNGDTAANYDSQSLTGNANVASAAESIGGTSALFGTIAAASATASKAGIIELLIPFYSGTTFQKEGLAILSRSIGNASGSEVVEERMFVWRSTAAVTRVVAALSAGNFIAGSRMIVYGET